MKTLSIVYQLKRRRLVSLGVLILGLLVIAMLMVPGWQPAGPVFAEKVGDGVALVIVEPEDIYRISWRRKDGMWEETEPFTGRVTATMGGDKLVVFHGLSYTTYVPGKDGHAPENERWDKFAPGWSVKAAASLPKAEAGAAGADAWAFGTIDDRTIVCARRDGSLWTQGPELQRPGVVKELTATASLEGAYLWWREDGMVLGVPLYDTGWTPPDFSEFPPGAVRPPAAWGGSRVFDVPADAHLAAATAEAGPALYAASRLKSNPILVTEIQPSGTRREISIRKDPPITAAIDSISVADGDHPGVGYASGLAAGLAFLDKDKSFEDLAHTLFRFRPGAAPWFMAMMFAALSIVGIGVSLLFERRKVPPETMVDQIRMLSGVAPLMSRAFAASIDTGPFLWGFAWMAVEAGVPATFAWIGAISLCCAYHTAAETIWGQTLGKRLAGIAVKRTDGSPAGRGRILVRNLIRAVELMFPLLPAVVMISTKRSQRLGDLVAGTMVARVEKAPQAEGEEAR